MAHFCRSCLEEVSLADGVHVGAGQLMHKKCLLGPVHRRQKLVDKAQQSLSQQRTADVPTPAVPAQTPTSRTATQTAQPPEFLTVAEAAALLRVSPATLRRRIKDNTLPAAQLAGTARILLRRTDLLHLLQPLGTDLF